MHWLKRNTYNKGFSTKQNLLVTEQFSDSKFEIERNPLFYRDINHAYIPSATAPPVEIEVASCSFQDTMDLIKQNKFYNFILYGSYKEKFEHFFKHKAARNIKENFNGLLAKHPSLTKI